MTSKERWLASVKLEPVDRLVFWPKINNSYLSYQSDYFKKMDLDGLHAWIGSDRHTGLTSIIREIRKTSFLDEQKDGNLRKLIYGTKYGSITATMKFDPSSQAWHPVEFPVKSRQDIEIMTQWYLDSEIDIDTEKLEQSKKEYEKIGQDAATTHSIGTTPLMVWVQHLAGIENCHYFLADYQTEVEELFDAMYSKIRRITEILAEHSIADLIYLVENTSTSLISPQQYKKYCYNYIFECGKILKQAGKPLLLHMCGKLKGLLSILSTLPVNGFEAFTSPPVGDTTLYDGRSKCPDKCLIGGTNAILWLEPAEKIISQIEKDLDILDNHRGIVISSAGVMPPFCRPETIKKVCEWIKEYRLKF